MIRGLVPTGAGLRLRPLPPQPGPAGGGPHALLRPRLPLPQERQVREHHRRLAPREPHALPRLLQHRLPRAAVEGAAGICATSSSALAVDDGFGGSATAAAAVGVGGGATEEAPAAAAVAVVRRYTTDAIGVE